MRSTCTEVVLLVGGEAPKKGSRIHYPLNASRRQDMDPSNWWEDVPPQELGPHDALPASKPDDAAQAEPRTSQSDAPAPFSTTIGSPPSGFTFGGAISMVLEKQGGAWRIVGGHSSTPTRRQ